MKNRLRYGNVYLLLLISMFFGACANKFSAKSQIKNLYGIYKIDSVNSYYLIYAKKRDSLYKIVSSKDGTNKGKKISINNFYKLNLVSIWNQPILINGVNVSPSTTPHVTCLGFDDSTNICIERDSINDLHRADNLRGLYIKK